MWCNWARSWEEAIAVSLSERERVMNISYAIHPHHVTTKLPTDNGAIYWGDTSNNPFIGATIHAWIKSFKENFSVLMLNEVFSKRLPFKLQVYNQFMTKRGNRVDVLIDMDCYCIQLSWIALFLHSLRTSYFLSCKITRLVSASWTLLVEKGE